MMGWPFTYYEGRRHFLKASIVLPSYSLFHHFSFDFQKQSLLLNGHVAWIKVWAKILKSLHMASEYLGLGPLFNTFNREFHAEKYQPLIAQKF